MLKLRLAKGVLESPKPRPFFLAVGFRKPHLPFRYPKAFLKNYPPAANVSLPKHQLAPEGAPAIAHHWSASLPESPPSEPLEAAKAREYRLAYRATISWVDSQIARVLDELERLGLA